MVNKKSNLGLEGKRGAETLMSLWLVLCLVLVGIVIVAITFSYLKIPIDTRESHSKIIYSNIYDCLVDNGYLNDFVLEEDYNLEKGCFVNFAFFKEKELGFIEVFVIDSKKENLKDLKFGALDLIQTCNLGVGKVSANLNCFSYQNFVNYYDAKTGQQESLILKVNFGIKELGKSIPIINS